MARTIKGKPSNLDEAIYQLDRGQLRVQGAKTRDDAVAKLQKEYGDGGGDTSDDDDGGAAGYDGMKADELRSLLAERDLPTGGNKADLVARLEEDDEFSEEDED